MPAATRRRLERDLATAHRLARAGDREGSWRVVEEAHVLSQPWAACHVRVHWRMLTHAVRTDDWRETTGQLVRLIVAAPGSWAKRYPVGNTGRARVGIMTPMPVSSDIARLLES